MIYVEMLGHDASWGHVKALQACSDQNLLTKKVPATPHERKEWSFQCSVLSCPYWCSGADYCATGLN